MNILLIGCGAIGGLYGAKWMESGQEVTWICRSNFETLHDHGLSIESPWGNRHIKPNCLRTVSDYQETADVVIITTKATANTQLIAQIAPVLKKTTELLILQNGIHIESEFQQAFPETPITSGLAFVYASQTTPGKIIHQDYGRIVLGRYPSGSNERAFELVEALKRVGVPAQYSTSILKCRWEKLLWNMAFNPASVLTQAATIDMLKSETAQEWMTELMTEVVELAQEDGVSLSTDLIEKNIRNTLQMPPYKTSMLGDAEHHKPLETEAIVGNAVRFAIQKNHPAPRIKTLYALLKMWEKAHPAT